MSLFKSGSVSFDDVIVMHDVTKLSSNASFISTAGRQNAKQLGSKRLSIVISRAYINSGNPWGRGKYFGSLYDHELQLLGGHQSENSNCYAMKIMMVSENVSINMNV